MSAAAVWMRGWPTGAESATAATRPICLLAVRDAVERFAIPLNLLDELVAGVTMDLDHAAA